MTKKSLNTRDALLNLRQIVSADADKAARIEELVAELNQKVGERSRCLEAALQSLEGYVALQTEMHGFNNSLEELTASVSRQVKASGNAGSLVKARAAKAAKDAKRKAAKAAEKTEDKVDAKPARRVGRNGGRNGGPQKATGYKGTMSLSSELSTREQEFVDLLTERWPTFITPQTITRKGIVPKPNHVTAKVNQLRKKGVPIESAKQARASDPALSTKTRGYRLIG